MTIKSITSRENPVYKDMRLLATSSQARRRSGRTLLDGVHLCQAYLDQVGLPQLCVFGETARTHPEVVALMAACDTGRATCVMLPDALFQALSQVEHGVDLLFVVDTPQQAAIPRLVQSAVLLDNLQDPGNLGSILRSAAGAGIASVFCSPGTAFAWAPKVLRAGMGAHFLLTIAENVDLEALIAASSIPVVATSSHTDTSLYALELHQPVAWLFGHEGQGVCAPLMALATHRVAIPQLGAIESLNVAASAAICFFEQVRQRSLVSAGPVGASF